MKKIPRFLFLLMIIGIAVWFLTPSLRWYGSIPEKEKSLLQMSEDELDIQTPEVKRKVNSLKKIRKRALSLGLDLQGGVNITLQVDEESLTNQLLDQYDYNNQKVRDNFETEFESANERAVEILKNRMDTFGVTEPSIRQTFDGRISIELPGLDNPQLIRDALSRVGQLTFQLVDDETMEKLYNLGLSQYNGSIVSREDVPDSFEIPEDSEWYSYWENDEFGIPKLKGWFVLKREIVMNGTFVKDARADVDQYGKPVVDFTLTPEGTDIFAEVTSQNIKKRLAIVLDDKVKSAPTIQSEIMGGSGQITGSFTVDETIFLANVLEAGALPVKLEIVQERVIGPTLGMDSIRQGTLAALAGAIAVMIFMVLYYKIGGLISIVALMLNMLFLISLLAGLGATLTLSGIAGIALTIGMAVDANVIIFERIREELRHSKEFRHALNNGYKNASQTIWDSNLTTLIAAFALFIFGSGTIKGFGITLAFGIISNIFSSLFITRLIFDWMLESMNIKKVKL